MSRTNKDWEEFAADDPYFSVLTDPEFRGAADKAEARQRFFASGEGFVESLFGRIANCGGSHFAEWQALDFGCGVGRLLVPMAKRCHSVTGVDVSPSMLKEAATVLAGADISNARLFSTDQFLHEPHGSYDLVNSFIVLQHIPPRQGMRLLEKLLQACKKGGWASIHVTYSRTDGKSKVGWKLLSNYPWLRPIYRLVTLKNPFSRVMQMNRYDLNQVLEMLLDQGFRELDIVTTNHSEIVGAHIVCRKL